VAITRIKETNMDERDKEILDELIKSSQMAINTLEMCTEVIQQMAMRISILEKKVTYLMGDTYH
jgi:hypothetical protein